MILEKRNIGAAYVPLTWPYSAIYDWKTLLEWYAEHDVEGCTCWEDLRNKESQGDKMELLESYRDVFEKLYNDKYLDLFCHRDLRVYNHGHRYAVTSNPEDFVYEVFLALAKEITSRYEIPETDAAIITYGKVHEDAFEDLPLIWSITVRVFNGQQVASS